MNLGKQIRAGGPRVVGAIGAVVFALLATLSAGLYSLTESQAVALEEWIPSSAVAPDAPRRSSVLATDGSVIATFGVQDRVDVDLADVAPVLQDAVLAIEDNRFYDHGAIDPVGMVRALTANIAAGGVKEGGSTLTQQYVKQAQVAAAENDDDVSRATETTISRKVREMGAALAVESRLDKDEILERYLNLVYFGNGAYGVQVASQRYFSKPAKDLTLPQAALLAGIVRSPTAYDPIKNPENATQRRNVVLTRMAEVGRISREEAEAAKSESLDLKPTPLRLGCADAVHPWFCGYVVAEVRAMESLGDSPGERMERLYEGGLTIRSTLDPKVQAAAQASVDDHIQRGHDIASAIVMTEPGTGAVRAIAMNRDWGEDTDAGETTVNYALDRNQGGSAGFQAGSAFKPFVAAAALKKGIEPSKRFSAPSSVTVDGFTNCATGRTYPPYGVGNYEKRGFGSLDLAQATAMSVNTYYVQLAEEVGTCAPPELAEKMGVKRADGEDLSRVPSFVLGVDEVSPLRLAEAYATFAADGKHCASRAIVGITEPDGGELEVPGRDCEQVLPKEVARGVTELLESVIDGDIDDRTGAKMSLGRRPAAGKTGTTNDATAVWFAGFTSQLAAAVWAGYPDGSRPLKNVRVDGQRYETLFGGALPGPIWRDAMLAALKGEPIKRLATPVTAFGRGED
ncbi:transglycosylase domain-containing protein [Sporichthya polymorpha]|uniref:transglycosylase domain-containing protein n=1 Tax=Sporichthya polymorpha TaxID=35751 RepID=UPI00037C4F73|nr:transglycosylase domain-containing protein [Sporichthya polymorpha]